MWKWLAVLTCAIPALAGGPRWSNTRELVLACDAAGPVEKTALWASRDDGRTWTTCAHRFSAGRIHASLPEDGWWSFYIVLENAAGASAPPPVAGSTPHVALIVDTAAPTFQILSARQGSLSGPDERPQVVLRTVLADDNLGPAAIHAYFRSTTADAWRDGGAIELVRGSGEREMCWIAPAGAGERLQLMIVVTDLAGNRASDVSEVLHLEPPASAPASQPASAPAASQPTSAPTDPSPQLVGPPDIDALRRAEAFRRRAKQNLLSGDINLALARFEEAIHADPTDAATYTELGSALLRANRFDDARSRFDAALRLSDRNVDALDGLAQVAVGQERFADAQDLLRRIADLSPDSAQAWLRLGDVEFKLGRRAEAISAWQRAAETGKGSDIGEKAAARLKTFAEKPAP